ncbi:hypothetical protein [Pseudomonas sp. NPDC089734]|uniref:hypothetical protein n=1 Tax=Pseudomonas sp. NPDC089734 TaxID=3364469 RepID=UPI0038050A8E
MIFLHIHRTGGSTVWHTLANAAFHQGHQVIDLYNESWVAYQNPFSAVDVIRHMVVEGRGKGWENESLLIHHHTRQNIEGLLPPEARCYVTLVRDPVERFVSEVFHIRKLLMKGAELTEEFPFYQGEFSWYRKVLGESLYAMFMQEDVGPDELLIEASKCPYYKDFYFNIFWSLLKRDVTPVEPTYYTEKITDDVRSVLVAAIKEKFLYVGQYPKLGEAVSAIAFLKGVVVNSDVDMVHVRNGSNKPDIRRETLDELRIANADEYRLLSMLEMPDKLARALERAGREEYLRREVVSQKNQLSTQCDVLNQTIHELQQRLQGTCNDLRLSQSDAVEVRMELNAAQNRIEELHRSTSWRLTAPFRSIITFVRRL